MAEKLPDNRIDGLQPSAANLLVESAYQREELVDSKNPNGNPIVEESKDAGIKHYDEIIAGLDAGQGPAPANTIPGYSPDAANLFVEQAKAENEARDAANATTNPTVLEGAEAEI